MKIQPSDSTKPVILFRGFALMPFPKLRGLGSMDKVAEFLFTESYPELVSNVAQRFNTAEAYKRYRGMRSAGKDDEINNAMNDHYKGSRDYSFFLSATEDEEQAIFFAGTSWKDNEYGAVVRFRRDHDFEEYSPTDYLHPYKEMLVVSCIEPREIEKIYIVGAKPINHMKVEMIFKKDPDGKVQKYRASDPNEFTYLKKSLWTRESFFNPPLDKLRPAQ